MNIPTVEELYSVEKKADLIANFVHCYINCSDAVIDDSLKPRLSELLTVDFDTARDYLRGILDDTIYCSLASDKFVYLANITWQMLGGNRDNSPDRIKESNKEKYKWQVPHWKINED